MKSIMKRLYFFEKDEKEGSEHSSESSSEESKENEVDLE